MVQIDNGLLPGRRQVIIWNNITILSTGPLGTNFNYILIEIHICSPEKIHLNMSSGKWRPFCHGTTFCTALKSCFNELNNPQFFCVASGSLLCNKIKILILIYFGQFRCQEGPTSMVLGGLIFYTILQVVSVSLKDMFCMNLLETLCKIDGKLTLDLILVLYGVQKDPKIWPSRAMIYMLESVPMICPWTMFHGPTERKKTYKENGKNIQGSQFCLIFTIKNPL